jgi:hypothetical protein
MQALALVIGERLVHMAEMPGAYFESISLRRYPAYSPLFKGSLWTNVLALGRAIPFDGSGKVLGSI